MEFWGLLFTFPYFHALSFKLFICCIFGFSEANQCLDFDLILTGGKPGKVETVLVCRIQHHREPVCLTVEASFKVRLHPKNITSLLYDFVDVDCFCPKQGPTVTLGVPSVDFGLIRLGEQTRTTFRVTNTTNLKSSWALEEKHHPLQDHREAQVPC